MSISKALKGCHEVLKLTLLRKGPRPNFTKPSAPGPVVGKYYEGRSSRYFSSSEGSSIPKFANKFFKVIFSRASRLLTRYTFTPLPPRFAGLKSVSVFSLIGFCLASDLTDNNSDQEEKVLTDTFVKNIFKNYGWEPEHLKMKPRSLDDLVINETSVIGNGCEGAVFEAKLKNANEALSDWIEMESYRQHFDLAVKSVFNYYAESNAHSILRKLNKELVPLQPAETISSPIDDLINSSVPRLPPHPNIVDMYCVFVDDMLVTEEGQQKFSAAMPRRVNPDICFARNKTLHLVMRKCTMELSKYLTTDLCMKTRCSLLMQLLEAVYHMTTNGIAHRDIKMDNILINLPTSGGTPQLQVCDFGCCLAEENKDLEILYPTSDMNIGGNLCLMAPEISCARPGKDSVLDFRRSDLWACGAVAYQILGTGNPFYPGTTPSQLKSQTYREDELPPLPDDVPVAVVKLVRSLLVRNPAMRPSPAVAVLVLQLVMFDKFSTRPRHSFLSSLTKKQEMELVWDEVACLMIKLGSGNASLKQEDMVEISKFLCLSRLSHSDLMEALKYFE